MVKIGDRVRFLSSVGGGVVTRIQGNTAFVIDEDGFETPSLVKELVVVGEGTIPNLSKKTENKENASQQQTNNKTELQPIFEEEYVPTEIDGGDSLNVVLAFVPENLQKLSTTSFETYLVNDSNYYLSFTYISRDDDSTLWTCRHIDTLEPNTQLFIGILNRDEINEIGHIMLNIIAYKKDKSFEAKPAISVERRIDVTKFFKLHCFTENIYFDEKVIAYDIIKNDCPYSNNDNQIKELKKRFEEKRVGDRTPIKKPILKTNIKKVEDIIVVDLHISELVDSTAGLSNADMLNLQIDTFRKVMNQNAKKSGQKIVFIHGKGEGVLRNALLKELNHKYKGNDVQDASFREYGFGATQVTIRVKQ